MEINWDEFSNETLKKSPVPVELKEVGKDNYIKPELSLPELIESLGLPENGLGDF